MAANDTTATTDAGSTDQTKLTDLAQRAELAARERIEELRERARTYYDDGRVRVDDASRFIIEQVNEKPLKSAAVAVGAGVILGLLLAGRRR
jgi:ElaB/YqjD/DUF883 family membrane-anchored ribosome-binding protein